MSYASAAVRKYSILLVCRSYPPVLGGSETGAQRVCAGLLARGHTAEVICCGGDPMPPVHRWTDPYGVPVRMFGNGAGRSQDWRYAIGVAWTLLTRAGKYDVVYFLMPGLHVAIGVLVARLLRGRIVMKFSGSNEIRKLTGSLVGRAELAFLRWWADKVMVLNDGMISEACETGFPPTQLLWMPNPVDTTVYAPAEPLARDRLRTELGFARTETIFIFVGRLAPEKELSSLLNAFVHASARVPGLKLVLAGDGPLRSEIQEQAHQAGIAERVIFPGRLPDRDVLRWLQASDAFALVSSLEGLPVSLIEAMAAGLPSIVSDIPAMVQLITHQEQGFVVPLLGESGISDAMQQLARDAAGRQRMGRAARAVAVERFSTDKVIDAYENLFSCAVGRG